MLSQTICTEGSTLTSSINDMNTAAPCQETLILFHLESLVTQAATGFLNCCQFAIVAKALFGLFLVLKSDLFLLI